MFRPTDDRTRSPQTHPNALGVMDFSRCDGGKGPLLCAGEEAHLSSCKIVSEALLDKVVFVLATTSREGVGCKLPRSGDAAVQHFKPVSFRPQKHGRGHARTKISPPCVMRRICIDRMHLQNRLWLEGTSRPSSRKKTAACAQSREPDLPAFQQTQLLSTSRVQE